VVSASCAIREMDKSNKSPMENSRFFIEVSFSLGNLGIISNQPPP
jgi:hypothetical protein